jgi:hypothetical protein
MKRYSVFSGGKTFVAYLRIKIHMPSVSCTSPDVKTTQFGGDLVSRARFLPFLSSSLAFFLSSFSFFLSGFSGLSLAAGFGGACGVRRKRSTLKETTLSVHDVHECQTLYNESFVLPIAVVDITINLTRSTLC